ncbi:winged helix-turn-helix transcriptional regulator [Streptomyces sp. NPDC051217]|uniref:winged helix-turn-helix transcriptional regulator n=1 Tax=Streptomyces sp. NPDC051217 TaxID=3365644 RepID=UPI00379C3609
MRASAFLDSPVVAGITEKMLTQRLRELERQGIVARMAVIATSRHDEYSLTPEGRSPAPVLQTSRSSRRCGTGDGSGPWPTS